MGAGKWRAESYVRHLQQFLVHQLEGIDTLLQLEIVGRQFGLQGSARRETVGALTRLVFGLAELLLDILLRPSRERREGRAAWLAEMPQAGRWMSIPEVLAKSLKLVHDCRGDNEGGRPCLDGWLPGRKSAVRPERQNYLYWDGLYTSTGYLYTVYICITTYVRMYMYTIRVTPNASDNY